MSLPGDSAKKPGFKVKITCGKQVIETKPAEIVKSGYNQWAYDSLPREFANPFPSVDTLADVFIYLVD